MKCLIMSRVIFCAAQDVTGVGKEHRESKRREGRGKATMDERQRVGKGLQTEWEKEKQQSESGLITDAAL